MSGWAVSPEQFLAAPPAAPPAQATPAPKWAVSPEDFLAAKPVEATVRQGNPSMEASMSASKPGFLDSLVAPIREGAIGRAFHLSSETAASRKEDPSDPLIRFEASMPAGDRGVVRGAAEFASGLTTPENLLIMAGTSGLGALESVIGKTGLSKLISLGFSADMLWSAIKQSPEFARQVQAGDYAGARQTLTKIGLTAGMAALGVKHGTSADIPPPTATDAQLRDVSRPYTEPPPPAPPRAPGPAMNRAQRRATVTVPETGIPESIERAMSEREAIIGKPRDQWTNSEVLAADDLRAQGYTGASGASEPAAPPPSKPSARKWAVSPEEFLAPREAAGPPQDPESLPAETPAQSPAEQTINPPESASAGTPDIPVPPAPAESEVVQPQAAVAEVAGEAPAAAADVAAPGSKAWEMTPAQWDGLRAEAQQQHAGEYPPYPYHANFHVTEVVKAIQGGKPVPPEVLDAYKGNTGVQSALADAGRAVPPSTPGGSPDEPAIIPPEAPDVRPPAGEAVREPFLEPRGPSNPEGLGQATTIRVPGENRSFEAQYAVRELADVQASHNAHNFEPNPEYQHTNDRNYSDAKNAERVVRQAQQFDPAYLVNDSPTAEHGAPVIDANGNVLGGNSRTMTLARVYKNHPEAADAYRKMVADRAAQFGIDHETVRGMMEPVLVRKLTGEIDPQAVITDLNKAGAAALTPAERAIADSRRLSDRTLEFIQAKIEAEGPDGSLLKALEGPAGAEVINHLVDDGIITPQERGQYTDERGILSADGKQRIARLMLGRLFRDSEHFENTPPEMRNKLERIVPAMAKLASRPDWDITSTVQEALDAIRDANSRGLKKIGDLVAQQGMFSDVPGYSPGSIAIAEILQKGVNRIKDSFNQYAADEMLSRPGQPETMFTPPTKEEAFQKAFVDEPAARVKDEGRIVVKRRDNPERGSFSTRPVPKTWAEQYAADQVSRRESARTGPMRDLWTKLRRGIARIKAEGVAGSAPIIDAIEASKKFYGYDTPARMNMDYWIGRVRRASSIADKVLMSPITPGGYSLHDIIRRVDNDQILDQYLIAQHAQAVEAVKAKPGKPSPTGRDAANDARLIAETKNLTAIPARGGRPSMTYGDVAGQVNQYARGLLNQATDAGLISRDLAAQLKKTYPNYVPLQRIFSALEEADTSFGIPGGLANLAKQTVVRRLEGSEREIENPLASLIQKTLMTAAQSERNIAARTLADYADQPGMRDLMRELGPGEKSTHNFHFLDDGKLRTFETTPEIAGAAKSLDVHQIGILGKILAAPARVMKTFTTGLNPAFILSNIFGDMGHTFVAAPHDRLLANPAVFMKSMLAAVKHDALWDEIVKNGAGFTSFDVSRDNPTRTIEDIRAGRSAGDRVVHTVMHPLDSAAEALRAAEDVVSRSEEFGRARIYLSTKEALVKQGRSEADAKILATVEANQALPDYLESGDMMRPFNAAIPYFNAGIQGARSFLRALERDPVKTSAKYTVGLMLPVAAATLWNLSDPERKKAYADVQEFEKENRLIIVPPHPVKDKQGRYDVYAIKLPPGMGRLTTVLRRFIEQGHDLDPVKMKEVADALVGTVSPIEPKLNQIFSTITPQAFKPAVQAKANIDFFRDKPKVPGRLQNLPPEMQVFPYTSGTAKLIAGKLGASPIKTEEFIKDTIGGMGSQMLNASDRVLAAAGKIPESDIGGTPTLEAVASRFTKARGGELDNKEFQMRTGMADEAMRQAVERAKTTAYYARVSRNEELAQRYLDAVAQRAKALVAEATGTPRYKRMEADQKLTELKRLAPIIQRKSTSAALARPIPVPATPPSQAGRFQ